MECVAPKNWREILMNGEGLVYPQWENAVAWVAIKDEEVYNAVFTRQPELLLNSDATVAKSGPDGLCRAVLMRAAQMDYWSRQSFSPFLNSFGIRHNNQHTTSVALPSRLE